MEVKHTGNIQPSLDLEEHDHLEGGVPVKKTGNYIWNGSDWERWDGVIDIDVPTEGIAVSEKQNTLASYNAYASEDTGTYYYIAKENDGGAWYIARKTLATGVWDFCKGASDVATAWTGRASQTYAKYSDTF